MQERANQLVEGSEDIIAPDDVFAQIMGKDKPGHVRMLGQGICPSNVWTGVSKSESERLLLEQHAEIEKLKDMLLTQATQQSSIVSQGNGRQTLGSFSQYAATPQPRRLQVQLQFRFFSKILYIHVYYNTMLYSLSHDGVFP